ncbi:hypothetical protein [Ruania halotolerans]|uniref:hypothetical protein n=1 Tax=Ruania halotolerans TaxID=2897773 RepID=UPI001E5D5736|nr:hypothetical protein [Ruania halotolerans]UFU07786.1 hypothetical protein LQF10_06710 [Ruania halotolerans]
MALSKDLTRLLTAALRSRATTTAHLAAVTGAPTEEVQSGVESLRRLGYLDLDDETITYRRPEVPITETIRTDVQSRIEELTQTAADLNEALGTLPALLQAWDAGGTDERTLAAEVVHGRRAPTDSWMLHFTRDTPQQCDLCIPDLSRLLHHRSDRPIADWTSTAMSDLRVRLIVSMADAADESLRGALARMQDRGTEIRMHPDPPSLFWVSDGAVAGLPFTWGQAWPTSLMTVRSEPIAEIAGAMFADLWDAASPLESPQRSWEPMLVLMNQGMTMEAAASRLGMAQRTARRRVADAMAHYGVSSQFALGAAWGRAARRH